MSLPQIEDSSILVTSNPEASHNHRVPNGTYFVVAGVARREKHAPQACTQALERFGLELDWLHRYSGRRVRERPLSQVREVLVETTR